MRRFATNRNRETQPSRIRSRGENKCKKKDMTKRWWEGRKRLLVLDIPASRNMAGVLL